MELTWFSAPDTTVICDLEEEPLVGEHFFADMEAYYRELAMWNPPNCVYSYEKNRKTGGGPRFRNLCFSSIFIC